MLKLRNRLLALFCLLVFIGFGFLFFRTWVVQKPFGVIIFINDGLSTNTLAAARMYDGGADRRLEAERFPRLALVGNRAHDYAVPDEAAAATAIATGVRSSHRAISVDPKGAALESLLALARKSGRATGLVTTGNLTDPTPAAFYAHTADARDTAALAEQYLNAEPVDIVLGGGLAAFTPENKGGHRKDGRDLWLELRGKGYTLVRTKAELENTPAFLSGPVTGLFAEGALPFSSQVESGSQQPTLSDMVRRAIEFLQTNPGGYFLVVDCALVTRAAEQNLGEAVLSETVDFDRALALAREYAGEKALVVAVGKRDVGGLSLNGAPLRTDHGVSLLGRNASGQPALTWATGPNAQPVATAAPADGSAPPRMVEVSNPVEPAAFGVPVALPTSRDMIFVGSGPGSEPISGFLQNTDVFRILREQL